MSWVLREKVPRDRIGVLLGVKGAVKAKLEKEAGVQIKVDSETGDVEITPSEDTKDISTTFNAKSVVQAIARGFSPEKASVLLGEGMLFESWDLRKDRGLTPNDVKRLQGRIIGRDGKMRRTIEELTHSSISVYGDTVSIIGESPGFEVAREAVQMLLDGRQHSTVYRYLSRERRKLRKVELSLWEERPEPPEKPKKAAQRRISRPSADA
ncbi:MAG: KH domain-containing protein [Candidatus Bathyarchaeia archaeon]